MKRLRRDKRGVSNVIVVMLSLVLIVIIVANVILWSYQMNQLDLERIQERIALTNAERITRSNWFTVSKEYTVNTGNRVSGTYPDTWSVNDTYETFKESLASYRLEIEGESTVYMSTYPRAYIDSVEIQICYRATDSLERWFLKAYNWTKGEYSDIGFNSTAGDSPTQQFKYYSVNLTNVWQSYVQNNGTVRVKLGDAIPDADQTVVDIDFLGIRAVINGVKFSLQNDGPTTCHIVAIWIVNSTLHKRYDANFFFNSGMKTNHIRADISLPAHNFTAKVITELGNIAVFRSG